MRLVSRDSVVYVGDLIFLKAWVINGQKVQIRRQPPFSKVVTDPGMVLRVSMPTAL
jgi:hypothetical protein